MNDQTKKLLYYSLIGIIRIGLYIIPPISQIILLATVARKDIVILIYASIVALFSLPAGIYFTIEKEYTNVNFCYNIKDPKGIYKSYSISTYLIIPTTITLMAGTIINTGNTLNTVISQYLIILPLVAGIILYVIGLFCGYYIRENLSAVIITLKIILVYICYIIFVVIPPTMEITLAAYFSYKSNIHIIIIIFSSLQTVASLYRSIKMFYDGTMIKTCCTENYHAREVNSGLLSGPHIICLLSLWLPTNLIISWVNAKYLLWYEHLLCYLPIIFYIFGAVIGYSMAYVKLNEPTDEEVAKLINTGGTRGTGGPAGIGESSEVEKVNLQS